MLGSNMQNGRYGPLNLFKGPYHSFCMFEPNIFNFIHVMLLTIIFQRIKPYFSFPDILQNLLIFQNQIFKFKRTST
ncbi:hypothetical protein LDENG_00105280 [Lucifuga dentata]|nr:hypothetical protein LDENG_00105280 [Lucifuga dentata]